MHARQSTPPESEDRTITLPPEWSPTMDSQPQPYQTMANKLGAFRCYTHRPTWYPNDTERLDLIYNTPFGGVPPLSVNTNAVHEISSSNTEPYAPFHNFTVATFMQAYFSGMQTKSEEHATYLTNVMQDPRFNLNNLKGFNAHLENVHLDKYLKYGTDPFHEQDGWREATVLIRLPVEGRQHETEDNAPTLPICSLFHPQLIDIITSVCASKVAESFNFMPYTMHWSPNTDNSEQVERIYGDTYMADAMVEAQTKINKHH